MENLNSIEKITLLISITIVALAHVSILTTKVKSLPAMKHFFKTSLTGTLFMSSLFMRSQDTICFKNKTIVVAKIMEVGISEIKYQRLDNLNGPNYVSPKNEIFLIKYSNGVTDTIRSAPFVSAPANVSTPLYLNPDRIRLSRSRMVYHDRTISDRQLKSMAINHPSPETCILLKKEFKKLNNYKLKESVLAPALFVSGAAIHFVALGSAFGGNGGAGSNDGTALASAFIVGAVMRVSGHVMDIVYRNKKKSKRQDIVSIYNGDTN